MRKQGIWITMKLNAYQIQRVSSEVGVGPVAETGNDHDHLKQHFGDHTFFLGPSGALSGNRWANPVRFPWSFGRYK